MHALIISADMAGAGMLIPVIRCLKQGGHTFTLVAPGKGARAFMQASIVPMIGEGDAYDVNVLFARSNPDVVLAGIASPLPATNPPAEFAFLKYGADLGLPTIAFEDFHGGHRRLNGIPLTRLVVVDRVAADLATCSNVTATVVAGYSTIKARVPNPEAVIFADRLRKRYGRVYVWASGRTFDDLELMMGCMMRTEGCLVPLFHPKVAKECSPGSTLTHEERWMHILQSLTKVDRVIPQPQGMASDDIVLVCDMLASGFSGMLASAAYNGVTSASLLTPEVLASLQSQVGLSSVPLADLGVVHRLSEAVDLSTLRHLGHEGLSLYDPNIVMAALAELDI